MKKSETYFLIKAIKESDINAFEKIYKSYYSKLYGFSKKFKSHTLQPEDFVQQTFLKVWQKREQLKEEVSFDQQLFVICKNLILNHLKRQKKMIQIEDYHLNFYNDPNEPIEPYNKDVIVLHAKIQKLPKKRREIFLLHKVDNLTYQEIAEYLCISKKTIANHIYIASNFLKKEIRK